MDAEERWVGVDDVAAHLGVAKDSVYRWIEERGLPAHRVGRLFRFKLSEIDDWVRQDKVPPAQRASRQAAQGKVSNSVQDQSPSKSQTKKSTSNKTSRKKGGNG